MTVSGHRYRAAPAALDRCALCSARLKMRRCADGLRGLQEELKCMPLEFQKIPGQPIPLKQAAFMAVPASPVSFYAL
jgi:hypothetical protein